MPAKNSSNTGSNVQPLTDRDPRRVNEAGSALSEIGYGPRERGGALAIGKACELTPEEVAVNLPLVMPENSPLRFDRRNMVTVVRDECTKADVIATLSSYDEFQAAASPDHVADIMDGLWEHYPSRVKDGEGQKIVARDWMRKLVGKPVGILYRAYDKLISTKRYGRPNIGDFLDAYRDTERAWNAEISLLKNAAIKMEDA